MLPLVRHRPTRIRTHSRANGSQAICTSRSRFPFIAGRVLSVPFVGRQGEAGARYDQHAHAAIRVGGRRALEPYGHVVRTKSLFPCLVGQCFLVNHFRQRVSYESDVNVARQPVLSEERSYHRNWPLGRSMSSELSSTNPRSFSCENPDRIRTLEPTSQTCSHLPYNCPE